jgi:hypothetical protein
MHTTYSSSEELEGKILKERDEIIFPQGLRYKVLIGSLTNLETTQFQELKNDEIFVVLGIADKNKFCEDHYGYPNQAKNKNFPGQFPASKEKDFPALTRVVMALMEWAEEVANAT